jgi:hypothetical protein
MSEAAMAKGNQEKSRVFVLSTGRCGSQTFAKACSHITNYTSAHESGRRELMASRVEQSRGHIEVDNRLSWGLGYLDSVVGDDAIYVHLTREIGAVVNSFTKRSNRGIMSAYARDITMGANLNYSSAEIANDYVTCVSKNIEHFLSSKSRVVKIAIESPDSSFRIFWNLINAEGDLERALSEFHTMHNSHSEQLALRDSFVKKLRNIRRKFIRVAKSLPDFLKNA